MHYGWLGTIDGLLAASPAEWLHALRQHYPTATGGDEPSRTQVDAWMDSFQVLRSQLATLVIQRPKARTWSCVFEYELPREGGRRPDLVLLAGQSVLVVEFKEKAAADQAAIDQVCAYARDLRHYHAQSHGRRVEAILVPTKAHGGSCQSEDVWVVPPAALSETLLSLAGWDEEQIDAHKWVDAEYAPLPFLVDAARNIFRHDPLPYIKRAYAEAQIPSVLHYLSSVAERASLNHERHLILLTGAPGSGKTLVGLQFVHEHRSASEGNSQKSSVFLSGNGPLIEVLQYTLRSTVFVQEVHHFIKEYGRRRPNSVPGEHVLVFDEAQRAWSRERMLEKQGVDASEPDIFVQIAERIPDWSVVIGLIGEGQEIHVGEEAGLTQWNDALKQAHAGWHVHLPPSASARFPAAHQLHVTDLLNLTTSLRTHVAKDVQQWVSDFLAGNLEAARTVSRRVQREDFRLYVTRSLADAKTYVLSRYEEESMKRYGLLASSKPSKSVVDERGVARDFQTTKRTKFGPWYIDPPNSPRSCCQLDSVVTEFGCQGLELDMPIVCWGDDVWWGNKEWHAIPSPRDADYPEQLRLNAYRVLLSRGRDGCIVWVPDVSKLDQTYQALLEAGAVELRPLAVESAV